MNERLYRFVIYQLKCSIYPSPERECEDMSLHRPMYRLPVVAPSGGTEGLGGDEDVVREVLVIAQKANSVFILP